MDNSIQQVGLPDDPGCYSDNERAAWLVYDEFGNPNYIATATFYEDHEEPAESQWVYRESRFDEDGVASLDEPDVDLFDGDIALMSNAEELFDYIAPSYAGAGAFLLGPAAVLCTLGAVAMSDAEAGEVIEETAGVLESEGHSGNWMRSRKGARR